MIKFILGLLYILVGSLSNILKLLRWLNIAPKAMQLAAMLALVFILIPVATSQAETRKLKLYFLHTGEKAEIAYKKNGRYIPSGLKKINRFLRDWRRNEPTKMDPRLLDLIWEVHKETGSRKHIHVISGYRSPKTNSLLRKRGRGVAKKSQHTLGKALDFFIPGVKLSKLRAIGLRKGLGGVGYYPRSGSPFVHMDTGRVRHWPRMSRKELVRVFPRGKTLHVPTDGKPLPGYNQAKAEYERKLKGNFKVASAEEVRKKPNILTKLFNRNEEDEGVQSTPTIAAAPAPASNIQEPAPTVALAQPVRTTNDPVLATGVPVPQNAIRTANPGVPIPQAPVPGITVPNQAGDPTPVTPQINQIEQRPEIIIASLATNQLPIPQYSPRLQAIAQNVRGNSISETESVAADNNEIEIASLIPVPTKNPQISNNIVIAENEVADTQGESVLIKPQQQDITSQGQYEVAAFSASEIEDLRNQFKTQAKTATDTNQNEIQLLTALTDNKIANQTSETANNAINAQLGSISSQTAIAAASASEPIEIANINIPVPQPSPAAKINNTAQLSPTVRGNESGKASPTTIEERMIGRWAFATKQSIKTISRIEPFDNIKNIFGALPSTSETIGFSTSNQNRNVNSFN